MRKQKMTVNTLPAQPYIGLCFVPYTTNSVGVVTKVEHQKIKGRRITVVTYHYEHAEEESYTRPYDEVIGMAELLVTESPLVDIARSFPTPYDESSMPFTLPPSQSLRDLGQWTGTAD